MVSDEPSERPPSTVTFDSSVARVTMPSTVLPLTIRLPPLFTRTLLPAFSMVTPSSVTVWLLEQSIWSAFLSGLAVLPPKTESVTVTVPPPLLTAPP